MPPSCVHYCRPEAPHEPFSQGHAGRCFLPAENKDPAPQAGKPPPSPLSRGPEVTAVARLRGDCGCGAQYKVGRCRCRRGGSWAGPNYWEDPFRSLPARRVQTLRVQQKTTFPRGLRAPRAGKGRGSVMSFPKRPMGAAFGGRERRLGGAFRLPVRAAEVTRPSASRSRFGMSWALRPPTAG